MQSKVMKFDIILKCFLPSKEKQHNFVDLIFANHLIKMKLMSHYLLFRNNISKKPDVCFA